MKQHTVHPHRVNRLLQASLVSALLVTGSAHALEGFTLETLPPLKSFPEPNDINLAGEVAGSSWDRYAVGRPVSWDANNNITLLQTNTASEEEDFASAINELGYVVGERVTRPALWINGIFTALPGGLGQANDINDTGLIVGRTFSNALGYRATVWDNLKNRLLGFEPEGSISEATAVNNPGQVVGNFRNASVNGFGAATPLIWETDGSASLLGTLPGAIGNSSPKRINDAGQIVGVSGNRAVIWQEGQIASLGTLGGASSQAMAINNASQIVGSASAPDGITHAFIWQDGVMYDLAPALEQNCGGAKTCFSRANGINDLGQVVAQVSDSSGIRAVKLSIEPGALEALPAVNAPLAFIEPVGAGPLTASPFVVETDMAVTGFNDYLVRYTNTGKEVVKIAALISNNGLNTAENVVSTLTITGQLGNVTKVNDISVKSDLGNCAYELGGTRVDRVVTVTCQHGNVVSGRDVSNSVEVVIKSPGKFEASVVVDSDTEDSNIGNNTRSL